MGNKKRKTKEKEEKKSHVRKRSNKRETELYEKRMKYSE